MKRFANWIDAKPHRFPLMLVVHTALLAAVLAATSFELTTVVTRVALASTAALVFCATLSSPVSKTLRGITVATPLTPCAGIKHSPSACVR